MRANCFILITCGFLAASTAGAGLELHPLFTNHGVLQQGLPVPVWGWTEPNARVAVAFGSQTRETAAGDDGRWMVTLDPLTASAEPAELTVTSGDEKRTVTDLLVGEVWLCSGQSNMAMAVSGTLDAEKMAAEAESGKFSRIRLFKTPVNGADERADRVESAWQPCSPESVARFSAAGFYFGRELQAARRVPVGLIQSANGGTNAYSWINTDTLRNDAVAGPTRETWKEILARYPEAKARYDAALAGWKAKVEKAKAGGKGPPPGRGPREPLGPDHVKRPAGHYNAMIAPLQPYAIRGAIWYQGEGNSRPPFADQYRDLMLALADNWRTDWTFAAGGGEIRDFPFYLVQLPNFAGGHAQGWPVIREQMLKFWQDGRNTGMVVTIDAGDKGDIHPKNKRPVGERLARFARGNVYGEDVVYSGPIYDSMSVAGNRAVLKFKHTGGGLKSLDGSDLRLFTIAGAEGDFVHAAAVIDGDTVVISSPDISEPRAVRYAWSNNPESPNFGNAEGLPASPFRTDSWEIALEP